MAAKNIPRRQAIPILYTRGSHYDVGFDMGRTFASIIQNFLQLSGPLNEDYLPLYNSPEGKNTYNETLETCKKSFPQYVREIEGIAAGAEVDFHKLFLLHMDEILPQSIKHKNTTNGRQPVGCSTIILNGKTDRILAHTEDALTETLNHYYFVVAHIINDKPEGKYGVTEERFMSLCYAGQLPGYTMSYNHHGLVFSINTLSADVLRSGKTPRNFITRALLSAENYEQALKIIKDEGVGAADGCSINMTFLKDKSKKCYNIEIAPALEPKPMTNFDVKVIGEGEHNYHVNKYERIKIAETNEFMQASSWSRMKTLCQYKPPQNGKEVLKMLGDCRVYMEDGSMQQHVKTIAVGYFDLNEKTYTLYSDNPCKCEPMVKIPLMLKE